MLFDLLDKIIIFQSGEKALILLPTNLTPPFICLLFNKKVFKVYKKDDFTGKIIAQSQQ